MWHSYVAERLPPPPLPPARPPFSLLPRKHTSTCAHTLSTLTFTSAHPKPLSTRHTCKHLSDLSLNTPRSIRRAQAPSPSRAHALTRAHATHTRNSHRLARPGSPRPGRFWAPGRLRHRAGVCECVCACELASERVRVVRALHACGVHCARSRAFCICVCVCAHASEFTPPAPGSPPPPHPSPHFPPIDPSPPPPPPMATVQVEPGDGGPPDTIAANTPRTHPDPPPPRAPRVVSVSLRSRGPPAPLPLRAPSAP